MKLSDVKAIGPRPEMPPGGSPRTDDALMAWARDFCARVNGEHLDRFRHGDLPSRELLPEWQLINHLVKFVLGRPFPDGEGPNHNHRLRFLSAYFSVRPTLFEVEAHRYAEHLMNGAHPDGPVVDDQGL